MGPHTILQVFRIAIFPHNRTSVRCYLARNKYAMKIDFEKEPPYFKISDTHYAATWLLHPDAPKVEMPDILKHRIARMKEEAGYEIG